MLESVVSTLLNRVLGAYVSNLNYSQLKVGIWSGKLLLLHGWSEGVRKLLYSCVLRR